MDGIFISYRRDDSAGYAGRLYDRLAGHFGAGRVFMDVEGIEPGTDFVDAIERAVASCRVLIVLIGDEWLDITDAAGRRRLDDPHDFIRLETGAALKRDIRVVPVLLDGTAMPDMASLPDDLKPLVRRHAVELTHKQWEATSGELIRTLEKILESPTAARAAATPPPATATSISTPNPEPGAPGGRRGLWIGAVAALAVAGGLGLWGLGSVSSVDVAHEQTRVQVDRSPAPAQPQAPAPTQPVAPAQLSAATETLDFGALTRGEDKVLEWTLDNTGGSPVDVQLQLRGEDAGQFATPVETCSAGLRAASHCQVSIRYRPTRAGAHRAMLEARADESRVALQLAGSAVEPSAPAPEAAPTPASPAPAPTPAVSAPRILTLGVSPEAGGAKLCYRTSDAREVRLDPPGEVLANPARDCVTVPLDGPTILTLTARGDGGRVTRQVRAEPASVATPGQPAVGQTWVYRSRGKWGNSPRRTVSVSVDRVEDGLIYESMRLIEPNERTGGSKRSHTTRPAIIDWTWLGWEFAPWLDTSNAIDSGNWSGFSVPDMTGGWDDWRASAKVVGRESVSVPAGRFEAVKVAVLAQRHRTGSAAESDREPVKVEMTVWYAPEAKRYVKLARTIDAASGMEMERDQIELIRYPGP